MPTRTRRPAARTAPAPVDDAPRAVGATTDARLHLMRAWTRLGVLFNTMPATDPVDLEQLVADTAAVARGDERLFVIAASWLAEHHHLVDARRLGRRLDALDDVSSAVAGAMLAMAAHEASGETALTSAAAHCRPLRQPVPLFPVMERHPGLLALVKAETLPLFAEWGFWHNDAVLKPDAVRPVQWILAHCAELRVRAILGPGLDAELAALMADAPRTVAELARLTGASYAAVHASVTRLGGRGLAERRDGRRCALAVPVVRLLRAAWESRSPRRVAAGS